MKFVNRTSASIFVFIICFGVYLLTVSKVVSFTDSGELASDFTTLGVAHPTGYPLITNIAYLWTRLPLPFTPVHSLNIFASLITALSAVIFFHLALSLFGFLRNGSISKNLIAKKQKNTNKAIIDNSTINKSTEIIIAVASALLYGFATTVWDQSTSIEVYAMQILLFNIDLFLVLQAVKTRLVTEKYWIIAAFIIGLSFANHMTTILVLPAVLFIFFKRPAEPFDFSKDNINRLVFLIITLLMGVSLYLYLPVRSSTYPEFNWGWVHRGLDKLLYHLSGKQYRIWMFSDMENIKINAVKFFNLLPLQLGWIGLVPALYGMWVILKVSREIFWFLIILIISCLIYSFNYSIHDIDSYFLLAFIGILLFASAGLYDIVRKRAGLLPLLFIFPLISLVTNYSEADCSQDYSVSEYTKIMTDNLQQNAIIISSQWDYFCSSFWYNQRIEGYRRDVVLVEQELLRRTWYPMQLALWYPDAINRCALTQKLYMDELETFESDGLYDPGKIQTRYVNYLNDIIDKNIGSRPVYITFEVLEKEPDIGKSYYKIPDGLAFRLEKKDTTYPVSVNNIDLTKFKNSLRGRNGHLYDGIKQTTAASLANIGSYAARTNQIQVAKQAFSMALLLQPDNLRIRQLASGLQP
jgi:hypothetical protein